MAGPGGAGWTPGRAAAATGGGAPGGRGGHAAGVVPGERPGEAAVVVFGGTDRSPQAFEDLWALQVRAGGPPTADRAAAGPDALAWERPAVAVAGGAALPPRAGASFTAVGRVLYLFGGQDPASGTCFNDIVALDTASDPWEWRRVEVQGGSPPPRHSHAACVVRGGCVLVFGGAGQDRPLNDVWVFDPQAARWTFPTLKGELPAPREMHTLTSVGGDRALLLGGRDAGGRVLRDARTLDLDALVWGHPAQTLPEPCCAHSAVAFPRHSLGLGPPLEAGPGARPADGGQGHDGGGGATLNGVLVFGGFTGEEISGAVLVVDPLSLETARLPGLASGPADFCAPARFAHAAVPLPGLDAMLVFGGVNAATDLSDVALLHLSGILPLIEELD